MTVSPPQTFIGQTRTGPSDLPNLHAQTATPTISQADSDDDFYERDRNNDAVKIKITEEMRQEAKKKLKYDHDDDNDRSDDRREQDTMQGLLGEYSAQQCLVELGIDTETTDHYDYVDLVEPKTDTRIEVRTQTLDTHITMPDETSGCWCKPTDHDYDIYLVVFVRDDLSAAWVSGWEHETEIERWKDEYDPTPYSQDDGPRWLYPLERTHSMKTLLSELNSRK